MRTAGMGGAEGGGEQQVEDNLKSLVVVLFAGVIY